MVTSYFAVEKKCPTFEGVGAVTCTKAPWEISGKNLLEEKILATGADMG